MCKKVMSAIIIILIVLALIVIGSVLLPTNLKMLNTLLGFIYGFLAMKIYLSINNI
jgi:uncharacterized membrane protein required for colicin V production